MRKLALPTPDRFLRRPPRRARASVLLLCAVLCAGCDTVIDDGAPIVLQPKEVLFRFDVSAAALQNGTAVASLNRIDLGAALQADGFTKAEVLSATVTAAELERIQPLDVNLGILQSAEVDLTATGVAAVTVASGSGFTGGTKASLTARTSTSASAFVTQSSFAATLRLTANEVRPGETYELWVTLRFRIEVEGI